MEEEMEELYIEGLANHGDPDHALSLVVHIRRSRGRVGVSARQLDGCVIDAEVTG